MKENHCKLNNKNKPKNVETDGRKPFSDKNNLLNGLYHIEQYDEYKVNQANSKNCYKPSAQGYSYLNSDWKVACMDLETQNIISRKMESEELGCLPNYKTLVSVNMESNCSENIKRHLANISPTVKIKQLSNKDIQKHLKMCNVVIKNISRCKPKIESVMIDTDKNNSLSKETILKSRSQDQNKCHFLRNRKRINYAKLNEVSLVDDDTFKNSTPSLDVYEFVCDSDEDKPDKKNSLSSSPPFEKEMKAIMRKIEKQHKKPLKRKRKMGNSKIKKVEKAITNDFQIFQNKPIHRTRKIKKQDISSNMKDFNINIVDKEISQLSETNNYGSRGNSDNLKTQTVDAVRINNVPKHVNVIQNVILQDSQTMRNNLKSHDVPMPEIISTLDENNAITTGYIEETNNMNAKYNYVNMRKRKPSQSDNHNELSDLSDLDIFDTSDHEDLSDVLDFEKINTKSTPLNMGSTGGDSLPWRPNLCTVRNPHFLQYKSTALPSYNQDLVIDSSAVEKVYTDCKTSNKSNQSGKSKQTSILSYIDKNIISESPDIIESSLFDIHELSPIKSCSVASSKLKSRSSVNKENMPIVNTPRKGNQKLRRQILGEKVDNLHKVLNNFTKSSEAKQISDNDEENSFFGFQSLSNSSHNENKLQEANVNKNIWLFGKPLRLEDYITIPKNPKHVVNKSNIHASNKRTKENVHETEFRNDEKEKKETVVAPEDQVLSTGLFEELEPPIKHVPTKRYERKTRKRVRRRSVSSSEESEDEYHMMKNKNRPTKQEKNDAEKWAREFNRMCQDVDNFPLEIE